MTGFWTFRAGYGTGIPLSLARVGSGLKEMFSGVDELRMSTDMPTSTWYRYLLAPVMLALLIGVPVASMACLLYTSDAADE